MKVAEIWTYPIKSLKGISMTQSMALSNGLAYDRQWMLVDEDGKFVSQRTFPLMAKIAVNISDDGFIVCSTDDGRKIQYHTSAGDSMPVFGGTVWSSTVQLQEVDPKVSAWFSDVLQMPLRLVKMATGKDRKRYSRNLKQPFTTLFADGYPFLILSKESVTHLNTKLSNPVQADRFRANIVVEDCEPHAEDALTDFKIGSVAFRNAKPCVRCILINTNQQTADRGKEPLHTLSEYRKLQKNGVIFGMNVLAISEGMIQVGDDVSL